MLPAARSGFGAGGGFSLDPILLDRVYPAFVPGSRPQVTLGLLGPNLDRGDGPGRWERWRPTVSLCQHEDRVVDRLELLHQGKFARLARETAADVARVSPETEVRLHEVAMQRPWDFESVFGELYDFAAAYPFDPEAEDYRVHITTGTHVAQICLFLLTESRHLPGVLVQSSPPKRAGAGGAGEITEIDLDLSRYDRIAQRHARERDAGESFLKGGIATRDAAFNRLIAEVEHVAAHGTDPILLTGPTGAGKSRLARRIYELKKRRRQLAGPLVEVNCATVRGDTAMSTLFGHVRGAFTGAAAARAGLLRAADGGLLFLDEVGELGPDEQTMLLRAVEEKAFLPVGADAEVGSDFQLVCGTHRDLGAEVRAGRFREDLLARIRLWSFRLPGLAERPDDLEPNLDFELEEHARRTGSRVRFNAEARRAFQRFASRSDSSWSGNFRDLAAAVRRMATLAPAGRITEAVVEGEAARLREAWGATTPTPAPGGSPLAGVLPPETLAGLDLFDLPQLEKVVEVCRASASLSEAGRTLFAASRAKKKSSNDADRLRKYLARFGLRFDELRP